MYRISLKTGNNEQIILIGSKFKEEIINLVRAFLEGDPLNAKNIKISRMEV